MEKNIEKLTAAIENEYALLASHPVFSAICTIDDLRTFMSWHVFAVWDFMSLAKRLQLELTRFTVPWVPPNNTKAARHINEIILCEETDDAPGGGHLSHYELYLHAMQEVGAASDQVQAMVGLVTEGVDIATALERVNAPRPVADFVEYNISTAIHGEIHEVLGNFFYGRENIIPAMFSSLLKQWKVNPADVPMFIFYLERHIALDGESHGPAAKVIIREVVGNDATRMNQLLAAALEAMRQRRILWDALQVILELNHERSKCSLAAEFEGIINSDANGRLGNGLSG